MAEAVIFDLDGIIVDTVPIHFAAWKKMFNEYGKDFSFEDYKEKVDGIPRMDGARAVLDNLSEEELKAAAGKKQNYFRRELDSGKIPVYDSTVKLIKKLKEEKIPAAVISSSKNCTYILKKIGIYELMDTVVDGNRNLNGKPDPEIFLTAARELGIPPQKCLVFEDALLGVQAARRAGMHCVGVDRYGHPERLEEADIIVKDISEINLSGIKEL
jgi:beta-phosphoglucomutase